MPKIETVKKTVNSFKEIVFAYLFGSYADDTFSVRSDIDIAVYLAKELNTFDTKLMIHHQLEIRLQRDIDLIILNDIRNYNLLQEILDNGILIKDSVPQEMRMLYELDKQHEILDFQAFQRMIYAA
jgi:predicted nucleotidyltransferase